MRVLTSIEMQQAEREAASRPGMSTLVLRRRAGYAVAQFCLSHFKFSSVCVVCGAGNNGANGLAAAESLQGFVEQVSVIILAKELSELSSDAASMCSRLTVEPLWIGSETNFETPAVQEALRAELILDAVTDPDGESRLPDIARQAIQAINDAFGIVVSVDVPSGADADSRSPIHERSDDLVFAQGIIALIAPRPAHVFGELTSGPIAVSEIGVQPVLLASATRLEAVTGQEVGIAFPPRSSEAHKGQFGHLLVVAGSRGKAGAATLAGIAALRAGAGLVTVACPESIQTSVAGFAPELMTAGLPETSAGTLSASAGARVDELLQGKDVMILGPGLSRNEETAGFVRGLVARCPLPLILDADGLNAFAGHFGELALRGEASPFRVLTPHPGEAARLMGVSIIRIQEQRLEMARRMASETGCCLVLKGWHTVVVGLSDETWINLTGNPALAKGGSGDVLCGVIGAALAKRAATLRGQSQLSAASVAAAGSSPPRRQEEKLQQASARISAFLQDVSVAAAVYLHGLAGDRARDNLHENSVLASDVLTSLAEAFHECELQTDRGIFYLQK